ncbi:pyrroline-5-carboxylate reductase [Flavobacterium aquaticum]|uniref:Pyrroline-5-carboxylate reductase n=1 Tax=Flavobacterium aquaticum TaxID=1236486 RepID=A0A327YVJ0_9FLAO|nr:pyrroline-5-carboxylate reductase [Flavobacterium aquaticum]RAK25023.1 pyrroline-5-carboxylate reductase [Flavobacterium aquaticum]
MKIAIIGFGNMGQTYANSFMSSGFVGASDILVLNKTKIEEKNGFGIDTSNFYTEPNPTIFVSDILILAVKPQDFKQLASEIKPFLNLEHVVLSVMAGISIEAMQKQLGVTKIVRSMPNIPTQIGEGMTVFCASNAVDRKELFIVQNLINTTGKSIYIEREEMLNAATAVSGSGPAYVFYFMQAMIESAVKLGFSPSESEFLVSQTFSGSVQLQNRSKLSNENWIQRVASKGGTTEAALSVFNQNKIKENIVEGIEAANTRAVELGS